MDMDWEIHGKSMGNPWKTDGNLWKSMEIHGKSMDKLMEMMEMMESSMAPKIYIFSVSAVQSTDFAKIGGRFRQQMLENSPDVCAMGHGVISGVPDPAAVCMHRLCRDSECP